MDLGPQEARVLGALAEKQLTTPQHYPLTLNALVAACNQTSNREPVVAYEDADVERAVADLRARGMVRTVLPSHGRSVVRFRQVADEVLGLDERRLAVLAVLLLRGPQTPGELRARTERMAAFDSMAEVEHDLEALAALVEPVVERLGRRPGQKEDRWVERLSRPSGLADGADGAPEFEPGRAAGPTPTDPTTTDLADLRRQVLELGAEVQALRQALDDLRAALGA